MILHSGECEDCGYTWEDELNQPRNCPQCGLPNVAKWAYEVEGNLRRPIDYNDIKSTRKSNRHRRTRRPSDVK